MTAKPNIGDIITIRITDHISAQGECDGIKRDEGGKMRYRVKCCTAWGELISEETGSKAND